MSSIAPQIHYWADRIATSWRGSVEGIVQTGRLIAEAKEALPRGEFLAMIETKLPFCARTAQRLMAISADERIATHVSHLPAAWGTLYELTQLDDESFTARIKDATINPGMGRAEVPKGARSIMSSRQEPDDSLDYFPTPPWATRAFMEHVFPLVRDPRRVLNSAWDPACGEGHITEVLQEYWGTVTGTDICDYSSPDGGFPPAWSGHIDFINHEIHVPPHDWIITNPPFGDKTEAFVLRALELARIGVAVFVRLQWLETIGRYETIFRDHPPTVIAFFAERVNLCKGRWDPEGSTATAYIWLVWVKGRQPRAPFWIPPGQREALTRPDDEARFTAHPVIKRESLPPHDPETGEIIDLPATGVSSGRIEPAPDATTPPGAGSASPSVDAFEIPDFLLRKSA